MIRPVLTEIGIFLIPFAVYVIYLLATRAGVLEPVSWPRHVVVKLVAAALVLTLLSLLLLVHFSGASPDSTYVPAHIENGRLIPGTEK